MIVLTFYISLVLVFFAYFGYPLTLVLLSRIKKLKIQKSLNYYPTVTFLITAFNEEKRIKDKLDNTLLLDYPKEKFQVLVASDGSTDATNEIIKSYEGFGVELYVVTKRGGKENAQKEAIQKACGEIIVFSDVATMLEPMGIKNIISNFSDHTVGCVSSEDRLIGKDGKPCGEGLYVKYEMWLRRIESDVNSLVGLSGSFFAARKDVCKDFSGDMQSDFRTLLSSIRLGFRGVSDPDALGFYQDLADEGKEFERKVRTVVRGLTVFFNNCEYLNPFKYGLFAYQLFCHKMLRWLVPFFLITAYVSNLILSFYSFFYGILLVLHTVFYAVAVWGKLRKTSLPNIVLKIPMYFLIVNVAILIGWKRYLTGQRVIMWKPSER